MCTLCYLSRHAMDDINFLLIQFIPYRPNFEPHLFGLWSLISGKYYGFFSLSYPTHIQRGISMENEEAKQIRNIVRGSQLKQGQYETDRYLARIARKGCLECMLMVRATCRFTENNGFSPYSQIEIRKVRNYLKYVVE